MEIEDLKDYDMRDMILDRRIVDDIVRKVNMVTARPDIQVLLAMVHQCKGLDDKYQLTLLCMIL